MCACARVFSFPGLPCAPQQRLRGRLMSCVMLCFPLFWPQSSVVLTRAVCVWGRVHYGRSTRTPSLTHTHARTPTGSQSPLASAAASSPCRAEQLATAGRPIRAASAASAPSSSYDAIDFYNRSEVTAPGAFRLRWGVDVGTPLEFPMFVF